MQKNIENINQFKDMYKDQLPILSDFQTELEKMKEKSPDHLYYLLTVIFGKKVYGAYVEWAEEAMKLFKGSRPLPFD